MRGVDGMDSVRAGGFIVTGRLQMFSPVISFLSPDPGLTKEPVLWTLVSKEPPAPAHETRHAGHDQGQEAGLSLNWAVPNVLVKDVPNFEKLSPDLESGTSPSYLYSLT